MLGSPAPTKVSFRPSQGHHRDPNLCRHLTLARSPLPGISRGGAPSPILVRTGPPRRRPLPHWVRALFSPRPKISKPCGCLASIKGEDAHQEEEEEEENRSQSQRAGVCPAVQVTASRQPCSSAAHLSHGPGSSARLPGHSLAW